MEMLRPAAWIAYLEGLQNLPLPDNLHLVTPFSMDKRLRALERRLNITQPPPLTEVTTHGLVWRIGQANAASNHGAWPRYITLGYADIMTPSDVTLSLDGLACIVDDILRDCAIPCYGKGIDDVCQKDQDNDGDCHEDLRAIVQKLYYITGRKRYLPPDFVPAELLAIYAFAAQLMFRIRYAERFAPVIRQHPVGIPPGIRIVGDQPRQKARSKSPSTDSSRSFRRYKKPSRFGWLSKLLFWRTETKSKPKRDDESDTTAEIVD
ncbi:hypothetical protein VHEMI08241 [[Torrubiella] hemipterigena]|uniref:Uncharacterized protein n=1 Tax=[Torrubiella] hemipterigena TaxID=1531966 RepID=A0A0A1TMU7_9HYPO|nr:hypothetical protein VHEMI08241 [[Torrubiella] hemipterigena]